MQPRRSGHRLPAPSPALPGMLYETIPDVNGGSLQPGCSLSFSARRHVLGPPWKAKENQPPLPPSVFLSSLSPANPLITGPAGHSASKTGWIAFNFPGYCYHLLHADVRFRYVDWSRCATPLPVATSLPPSTAYFGLVAEVGFLPQALLKIPFVQLHC